MLDAIAPDVIYAKAGTMQHQTEPILHGRATATVN